MALAGELAKYVGNELVKSSGKELAKAGARSALSSLVPSVATKVGTDLATKAGTKMATESVLGSLVPTIRTNWRQAGDIEGMLNGKFLGTNENYFPSVFSEGALGRATYGADQPIDQKKVAGLVRAIKNNEDIAPIAGFKNNDGFIDVYDGHHRLAAYQKAGKMPRVKLFDPANKSEAYSYADEWAKNAVKEVQQYLPAKPKAGLDEYGMGTIDLRDLNTPKVQQSLDDGSITLYHGTPNKFEDFDENLPSVWFSDSDKNLRDTGLTIKGNSPMNVMERRMPKDLKIADEDLADRLTKQQLQDRGYAGIAYTERGPNGDETYYEIFKPNQTLQKNLSAQQSLMELTPEQAEFFKDSKLRDANGQLIPVYHSTPANFTVFDNSKLGENTGYDNTALGHFVTNDKDFSSRFKDIDGKGLKGNTMELYANVKNPITHPYLAGWKYDEKDLDKIVEDYLIATDNQEGLDALREMAEEDGSSLYDAYMDLTFGGDSPFEYSASDRDALMKNGYDAVEIIEGPKSGLVDGSKDDSIISSYAIFDGKNLKNVKNLKPTNNPDINRSLSYGGYNSLANDAKKIGSADVAPIDPETLPGSYDKMRDYLADYKNIVPKAIGKPASKVTKADLVKLLEDYGYDTEGTKWELWNTAQDALEDEFIDELYENNGEIFARFLGDHRGGAGITGPGQFKLGSGNRATYLDSVYSDRLGIGRSHTPMADSLNKYNRYGMDTAGGDYMTNGIGINLNSWGNEGEGGVSTIAHERMHAWQDQGKGWNYPEEFRDAYEELRKDLEPYFHDREQILKDHPNSHRELDYWARENEQEARMLQSYLENEGFTKTGRKPEWGNEIKPAFDKFYKKLRAMSKKGIALPAIAGLFGLGAMAGKKEDSKKLDNIK